MLTKKEKKELLKLIDKARNGFDIYREDLETDGGEVEIPLEELKEAINAMPVSGKKLLIVNKIRWDTDGISAKKLGLPDEVIIKNPTKEMLEDDMYADAVGDYLSKKYEYCVERFHTVKYAAMMPAT